MARVPSTTISLLSNDSQNTLLESDEPADTSLYASSTVRNSKFGPGVNKLSKMQPDDYPTDDTGSLKELSEKAWFTVRANSIDDGFPTAEPTEKQPARIRQRRALDFKSWAWEVVNAVLLFVMIIATVITLRMHDEQPVPDWPFSITINAMVSTYALVFKGNVALILTSCIGQLQWSWYRSRHVLGDVALFQDAGRSPYGALTWLLKRHLHQPIVALAALVTILGVAIDPFFQQLAQSASCHSFSEATQKPAMPRTNYFNTAVTPSRFNSSVAAGFYQPPNLSGLDCSTGNCTFDAEYSTLAFCSKCEDISDQIKIDIDCPNNNAAFNRQWSEDDFRDCTLSGRCLLNNCSITTRVDRSFSATYLNSSQLTLNFSQQRLTTNSEWRTNGQPLGDVQSMLWNPALSLGVNYGIIQARSTGFVPTAIDCENGQKNNTWECRGYGAAKCSIQPCVRTYTASIDSNQLHEKLIESTNDSTWGFSASVGTDGYPIAGLIDKHCIDEDERARLIDDGYKLNGEGRWLAYNFASKPPDMVPDTSAPSADYSLLSKCAYGMDSGFLLHLFSYTLPDILKGQVDQASSGLGLAPSQDVKGPQQLVYLYDSVPTLL